ncbi:histidinol dehydrogenase [Phototrophicus methaneseepsis]|uniref:histidinol dehydrogenase n=1 Tax=Phototrophicus methaneseepsis TaxID=2710758 RepID=A0A7S8E6D7_9CHLR|nr:histidinol dehydrogenase [Phototrophicus methaneseepsis]QPC81221.1 histidinol dehydrogenase [Phototrophicus methaneseepsis]
MIQYWELDKLTAEQRAKIMTRAEQDIRDLLPLAQEVIDDIRANGNEAVVKYARKFDAENFTADMLRATPEDFAAARANLDPKLIAAIEMAYDNIRTFHEEQMPEKMWFTEVKPGIMAGEKISPIASAALYVPRGKGAFPSVMLMLATPAKVAGVPRVVVVTPPRPDGKADDASLVAAEICGIDEVYVVGGIQSIAAVAFGTETIPAVDKIIGPGSSYVSSAKRLLYGTVDVGLPAGPSESIILADENADPRLAALDLLVEAEHGPDSAAILVTHSKEVAEKALEILPEYIAELPAWRREFVETVLSNYGGVMLTGSLDESIAFVNDYAPEHLEVMVKDPFIALNKINNAGEILLGDMTPIPTANYALGLNAILPTGGFAKTFSSVSIWDFLKRSGVGYLSREGYDYLQENVAMLADYEGFPAHAQALRIRNQILNED